MPSGYQPISNNENDVEMSNYNTSYTEATPSLQNVEKSCTSKASFLKYPLLAFVVFSVVYAFFVALMGGNSLNVTPTLKVSFDLQGRYTLVDFDSMKPFSDFLNGIGGVWGVPCWAFFVNRGQCIASFGKLNKDGGILKFDTAEKAYQETPFSGFRTFVKGFKNGKKFEHMPFFPKMGGDVVKASRKLMIGENEIEIEEVEESIDLQTNIVYFTPPGEEYPSLVRKVTFTNLDENESLKMDVLDGLGRLIPAGLNNGALDGMGRTMEAWMGVYNLGKDTIVEPFFHISQDPGDVAQVKLITDGNFVVSFIEDGNGVEVGSDGLHTKLPFVVDPSLVYDTDTTLMNPKGFFGANAPSVKSLVKQTQGTTSRTPCAFAGTEVKIPAGGSVTITSVYGHAIDLDTFVNKYSKKVRKPGYSTAKRTEALEEVRKITEKVETVTGSELFNKYVKGDYLDNVLRGGMPVPLGDEENPKPFHIYSRIHGDLERDYNFFALDTTYLSQGPGNFRDVNQNRRLDVLTAPFVKNFNIQMFLSLVQADGYNPLTVASTNFVIPENKVDGVVSKINLHSGDVEDLKGLLTTAFRPGQLFMDSATKGIVFADKNDDVLNTIISAATQSTAAAFNQNGYWSDHWGYTLDLVDNYLAVYPDEEEKMLYDSDPIPFYMSPATVKTRTERYSVVDNPNNPASPTIRMYGAVDVWGSGMSPERENAIIDIKADKAYLEDKSGAGGLWQRDKDFTVVTVSAIGKLLILGSLKFSTLDPMGMGVEMEGGKPGWNDAMNGLPGILGSGMPETYEMLRIIKYVSKALKKYNRAINVPMEFKIFLDGIDAAFTKYETSAKDKIAEFKFWDASNDARETYREVTNIVFTGKRSLLQVDYLTELLEKMVVKTEANVVKAVQANGGISPTYFSYECTDLAQFPPKEDVFPPNPPRVVAKEFEQHGLPLFLEGPTRHLKIVEDIDERRKIYNLVKNSDLYDKELKMYTISESLASMSQDLGRMKAFSPGWLENQSVWLHMSYKYYLELLRGRLYEEFFKEIKTGLVPFMDNQIYGRSPLEAASFIVSSAFPDKKLHGASFLPRLSGSTAEMLSIWAIMMQGEKPFSLNKDGELQLSFSPVIPEWLWTEEGKVSFMFLGGVKVTYTNVAKSNSWDLTAKQITLVDTDGNTSTIEGAVIGSVLAKKVRKLKISKIEIEY